MAKEEMAAPSLPVATPLLVTTLAGPGTNQFIHFPTLAAGNVFNGNNLYQWKSIVERILRPRKLHVNLTKECPKGTPCGLVRRISNLPGC